MSAKPITKYYYTEVLDADRHTNLPRLPRPPLFQTEHPDKSKAFKQPEDTVSAQMSVGSVFLLIDCLFNEEPNLHLGAKSSQHQRHT